MSLLWRLRCHCNPDHNKFSSLSNTTVVSIFPNLCLWQRSLHSNVGGIDLEKLYRATLSLRWSSWNVSVLNLLFWALPAQNFTYLTVSLVVNGPDNRCFLPFLQFSINLATHYVIHIVCQNPCFSKTRCRVSSISVAPANTSFTSLASASVSLLGLVCTTAGHISRSVSQLGPFSQISRRSLDRMPLLPTSAGFCSVPTYLHFT